MLIPRIPFQLHQVHLANRSDKSLIFLQIALLKRAVEKFKKQLANDEGSICSDHQSPKLSHHRVTPISPIGHHNRVTTSAIINNYQESDGRPKSSIRVRKKYTTTPIKNGDEFRSVTWKSEGPVSEPVVANPDLKEVHSSLERLDRKMYHLETLLNRLHDRLGQQVQVALSEQMIAKEEQNSAL